MSEQEQNQIVFRRSNRVILRPVLKEDLPRITRWINDPEVTQYLNAFYPMMEATEEEWFKGLHDRPFRQTVVSIVAVPDNKHIGTMGLHDINMIDRVATTGTMIGEKEYQSKGYGTEAKMLLLDYAFNRLNLRKICSRVIEYNERSYAYSIKCGYKKEGALRQHVFRHGQYWDEILLAVFREDWLPRWEAFKKEHGIVTIV